MITKFRILTKQGKDIYNMLLEEKALTTKEISTKTRIKPENVYRTMQQLLRIGLVEQTLDYPAKFKAVSQSDASNHLSNVVSESLSEILKSEKR